MLYIASDHAGYQLKKYLIRYLKTQLNLTAEDLGPAQYNEDDDYPEFALPLAQKVASDPKTRGILICGTGHGVCMVANKTRGIRAILGYSIEAAEFGRRHEDANVLCLAGRVITEEHAAAIVKKFLATDFEDAPRHVRRLAELKKLDK